MNYEFLPPDTVLQMIKKRKEELTAALKTKLKAQKNIPQGHLRIARDKSSRKAQFYYVTSSKDKKGEYIPYSNIALARKIAQKDYDSKVIQELQKQIKLLEKYIRAIEEKISKLYTKLSQTRQTLITPVTLTDQQYAEIWKSEEYKGLDFREDAPEYYTTQGERVRSKSEIIIADTLSRYNIPYRYEHPLYLKSGRTIHPDFLCLNLRTRQEFYWEHFGMLDDPDYTENAVLKVKAYNENGIFPGINLIITMETQSRQISTPQIEELIKAYLT